MTGIGYSDGVLFARLAASDAARLVGAAVIEPAHLLVALCELCDLDPDSDVRRDPEHRRVVDDLADLVAEAGELRVRFAGAQLDPAALRRLIRGRLGVRDPGEPGDELLRRGPAARMAFGRAEDVAEQERAARVDVLHLLRAVLEVPVPQWVVPASQLGVHDMLSALFPPEPPAAPPSPGDEAGARVELEVLTGTAAGRRLAGTQPSVWVIGRAADCQLVIPPEDDDLVSRHHAMVEVTPPHARVRDLGSRNGTLVNGRPLPLQSAGRDGAGPPDDAAAHRDLADGDELTLGATRLRVRVQAPSRSVSGPGGTLVDGADRAPFATAETIPPTSPPAPAAPAGARSPHRCRVCDEPAESADPLGEVPELCTACRHDPDRVVEVIGRRVEVGDHLRGLFYGYTVTGLVGDGGMGRVYLARDDQTADLVCIKIMLPAHDADTSARMFRREADNGRQLRHEHIVRQREHGVWNGVLYLVTDYCDGGDLRNVIEQAGGRVGVRRAVQIAMHTLEALHYAHTAEVTTRLADGRIHTATGVVHRDISFGNVLFSGGVLKIGDLGLSKAFAHAGRSGVTDGRTWAGKPFFVPRRQVLDFLNAGPEVDVWATAACLYQMLTDQPPREFGGYVSPVQAVLEEPVIPIRRRSRTVPDRLARVVDDALSEDSDEPAFRTAEDLRDALEAVLPS